MRKKKKKRRGKGKEKGRKRWEERVKDKEKKVSKVCVIKPVTTVGNQSLISLGTLRKQYRTHSRMISIEGQEAK